MFNWLRELKEIWREPRVCLSCEVLKVELSNERREKQQLLDHLLTPRSQESERLIAPEPQVPIHGKHIPWAVRQQMLEQADREKAKTIQDFRKKDAEARKATPNPVASIEDLEANLGIVQEK